MEAHAFAAANYREEHRKWYLGDSISAGIGQGYNAFTPMQQALAIATIANNGVAFRAASGEERRQLEDGRRAADCGAAFAHDPGKTRGHRLHPECAGRRKQGGHGRRGLRRREVRFRRQDRHLSGVLVEGRKVQRVQDRRAAARPCLVRRLCTRGPAENRPVRAGGERRIRRTVGCAHRTQGVGLLPAGQSRAGARAGAGRKESEDESD